MSGGVGQTDSGCGLADARTGEYQIYLSRRGLDGAPVADETQLTDGQRPALAPALAWADNGYVVAWADAGDRIQIFSAALDATGAVQGEPHQLTYTVESSYAPVLANRGPYVGASWLRGFARLGSANRFDILKSYARGGDIAPTGGAACKNHRHYDQQN